MNSIIAYGADGKVFSLELTFLKVGMMDPSLQTSYLIFESTLDLTMFVWIKAFLAVEMWMVYWSDPSAEDRLTGYFLIFGIIYYVCQTHTSF